MVIVIRGRSRGRNTESGVVTHRDTDAPGQLRVRPPAGRWLIAGGEGRLTAYAATATGLVRWTETAHGAFEGPRHVEVPGWRGPLSLARSPEGYVCFAGLRGAQPGGADQVIVSTQYQTGRPLTDWYDLGVPSGEGGGSGDPVVGGPLVVVNQTSGSVHVLVSLRHGGIVRRSRSAEGRWGRWKNVTDRPYTGEFTAAMPTGGPLEILAVSADGSVDRWAGAGGGRFELRDRFGIVVADGTLTALETGRKRTTYLWRYPGDDSLVAWRGATGTAQAAGVMALGGPGGRGRPGAARTVIGDYDCTVLAQCGAHGGIEVTAYVTENESYGTWWAPIGDPTTVAFAPQPGVDGAGRLVVAALDGTGALLVSRQDPAQDGLVFGPWQRVGDHAPSVRSGQR